MPLTTESVRNKLQNIGWVIFHFEGNIPPDTALENYRGTLRSLHTELDRLKDPAPLAFNNEVIDPQLDHFKLTELVRLTEETGLVIPRTIVLINMIRIPWGETHLPTPNSAIRQQLLQ